MKINRSLRAMTAGALAAFTLCGSGAMAGGSAPGVVWDIANSAGGIYTEQNGVGYQPAVTEVNGTLTLTLVALDNGGIKSLTIGPGELDGTCLNDKLGQNVHGDFGPNTQKFPTGNGQKRTMAVLVQKIQPFRCNAGFVFKGGTLKLAGAAKNFNNLSTITYLTITINP